LLKKWIRIFGFGVFCAVRSLWASMPAQDLYKEAQLQENTARNVEAAGRLYEEFLNLPGTDRRTQADAWLHLGLCKERMGQPEEARGAWRKVVQDYSDVSEPYSQALSELQRMQLAEKAPLTVQSSSPIIQIVHDPMPTRWNLDFLKFNFLSAIDGKGDVVGGGLSFNFDYFLKRGRFAVGLSGGSLGADSYSSQDYTDFLNPHVRFERRTLGILFPYLTVGPSFYRFKFTGVPVTSTLVDNTPYGPYYTYTYGPERESVRWTAGLASEVGIAIGWTRGFTLNVGYSFHVFPQVTPSQPVQETTPGAARNQNHGLRLIGGPLLGLSFRW